MGKARTNNPSVPCRIACKSQIAQEEEGTPNPSRPCKIACDMELTTEKHGNATI